MYVKYKRLLKKEGMLMSVTLISIIFVGLIAAFILITLLSTIKSGKKETSSAPKSYADEEENEPYEQGHSFHSWSNDADGDGNDDAH